MRFILLLFCLLPTLAVSEDSRLSTSRELSERLQVVLGKELKTAMQAGGPITAIRVCNERAPQVAAQLSVDQGARVGRTALRVRNLANAPDPQARAVLEDFQRSVQEKRTAVPEYFSANEDGSARYMRAIYLQPLCSTCHGQAISPAVEAAIRAQYPQDQATGFAVGELRGAFIVDWPATRERVK